MALGSRFCAAISPNFDSLGRSVVSLYLLMTLKSPFVRRIIAWACFCLDPIVGVVVVADFALLILSWLHRIQFADTTFFFLRCSCFQLLGWRQFTLLALIGLGLANSAHKKLLNVVIKEPRLQTALACHSEQTDFSEARTEFLSWWSFVGDWLLLSPTRPPLKVISQFWNGKRIYTDRILLLFHLKGSFTAVRFALCWKFSNKNQWYRRFLNKFRIFRISFL